MKNFLYNISKIILDCFKGYNLFWQVIAILLTYILVISNFDWYYFINTRSSTLNYFFFPAIIFGGILPIILPIYLIIRGYFSKKENIQNLGWVLAQAAIMGSFISSLYKTFTGRIQPSLSDITTNISHGFNFGFMKHGIFWGWPSSHTTVAFAMAFTLIYLYPKNKTVRIFSILYAFYIGIGVSLSIHWFSDFVAGAIMGTIIGITTVKIFLKSYLRIA